MQKLEDFLSSLPTDLTPEQKNEKIVEFAKTTQESYINLQSAKDIQNTELAKKNQIFLEEVKKVQQDETYFKDLYTKDPEMAKQIFSTFGKPGVKLEDVISGAATLPNPDEEFDKRIQAHERKKEATQTKESFKKSAGLSSDEEKAFDEKLSSLTGGRDLSAKELKPLLIGIAFEMGKRFSSKEAIIAENNVIPSGKTTGSSDAKEYKANDEESLEFAYAQGILTRPPQK